MGNSFWELPLEWKKFLLDQVKSSKDWSEKFKNYSWEKNFGYGTKAHLEGLKKHGITDHHRKGFKPIHNILLKK